MDIGFTVNSLMTERDGYTTTQLAMVAVNRGHRVWYMDVGDFALRPDDYVYAHAVAAPQGRYRSPHRFLGLVRDQARHDRVEINMRHLDVLMLRNDPAQDAVRRPWAQMAAINFANLALRSNVLVLNDPVGLSLGLTKLNMDYFPEQVRPRTLVTRDRQEARDFIAAEGGHAVMKPLTGSGGHHVFLVRPGDAANLNQMFDAIAEEGFVIVQEFLKEAVSGDTRLFLMNGEPLRIGNKVAAIHRQRKQGDGDIRSNMSAGAIAVPVEISDSMLELAELVRPRLVHDGIFFAGLDVVGDRIMEINVQSPGGLQSAGRFAGVNFAAEIISAVERKHELRLQFPDKYSNRELATL